MSVPEFKKKSIYEDDPEEELIVTTKKELYETMRQGQKGSQQDAENGFAKDIQKVEPEKTIGETKDGIDLTRQDNLGKSVVHYIVTPVSYGSYENAEFLEFMIKYGFKPDLTDNTGLKPYQYAMKQSTGELLNVFKDLMLVDNNCEIDSDVTSFKPISEWEEVPYLKDAQDFLDLVKMNVDKESLVP